MPGNIGGQLGLFVGASLLTIAEIVEFGFYRGRGAIRQYQKDRKKRMSDIGKETSCAEQEPLGKQCSKIKYQFCAVIPIIFFLIIAFKLHR